MMKPQVDHSGVGSISYDYDSVGNGSKRSYPGSVADYSYDGAGRLDTATETGLVTDYDYNAAGALKETVLPGANGYVETRSYDRAGRPSWIKNSKGTSVLSKRTLRLRPRRSP
jgi:YD repeat-containing protein